MCSSDLDFRHRHGSRAWTLSAGTRHHRDIARCPRGHATARAVPRKTFPHAGAALKCAPCRPERLIRADQPRSSSAIAELVQNHQRFPSHSPSAWVLQHLHSVERCVIVSFSPGPFGPKRTVLVRTLNGDRFPWEVCYVRIDGSLAREVDASPERPL